MLRRRHRPHMAPCAGGLPGALWQRAYRCPQAAATSTGHQCQHDHPTGERKNRMTRCSAIPISCAVSCSDAHPHRTPQKATMPHPLRPAALRPADCGHGQPLPTVAVSTAGRGTVRRHQVLSCSIAGAVGVTHLVIQRNGGGQRRRLPTRLRSGPGAAARRRTRHPWRNGWMAFVCAAHPCRAYTNGALRSGDNNEINPFDNQARTMKPCRAARMVFARGVGLQDFWNYKQQTRSSNRPPTRPWESAAFRPHGRGCPLRPVHRRNK